MSTGFSIVPVSGIPMVEAGDDLARVIDTAATADGIDWDDGDIICIAQKIVSKAEGQLVPLSSITPTQRAIDLGEETDKDPRLVQLILDESTEVLRQRPGVLIVRHNLGFVGAHAGIDQSNVDHGDEEQALLLPKDPDASAARIKADLEEQTGKKLAVVITDSHNRPWRMGTIGAAIGAAGITVLDDHRGGTDIYGRELKVTLINRADAIAAAATLTMGETTEKIPVAVVRGFPVEETDQTAAIINRPLEEDLFR